MGNNIAEWGREWPAGVDLRRLFDDRSIRSFDKIIKEAVKLGEIRLLKRAGVRIFCVEKLARSKGSGDPLDRVNALLSGDFLDKFSGVAGTIKDTALIFEGASDDGLEYRIQFGPYDPKNPKMVFLKPWSEELKAPLDANDLFLDVDLFEKNFSFAEHSFYRWASTKLEKADSLIQLCAKAL